MGGRFASAHQTLSKKPILSFRMKRSGMRNLFKVHFVVHPKQLLLFILPALAYIYSPKIITMTTKQKIKKELDNMPDKILQQVYKYLHNINRSFEKRKPKQSKKDPWEHISTAQFFEGYSDKNAIYDAL